MKDTLNQLSENNCNDNYRYAFVSVVKDVDTLLASIKFILM